MINIRDKIWLFRRHLKTNRPYDKLNFRHLGSFLVVKQINDVAFHLKLPPSMKINPVFHVSLFESYKKSSISGRFQVPPPPVEIEGQEKFKVSKILELKIIQRKIGVSYSLAGIRC
jgi:hypothetical protein